MKIESYKFSFSNITEDLKNKWFYLYSLEIGKISRINRFIPITKVKFKDCLRNYSPIFEDEYKNEIKNIGFEFFIFETLQDAQKNLKLVKEIEIEKLQVSINSIMNLQEKIKKL